MFLLVDGHVDAIFVGGEPLQIGFHVHRACCVASRVFVVSEEWDGVLIACAAAHQGCALFGCAAVGIFGLTRPVFVDSHGDFTVL